MRRSTLAAGLVVALAAMGCSDDDSADSGSTTSTTIPGEASTTEPPTTTSPSPEGAPAVIFTGPVTGGQRGFAQTSTPVELASTGFVEEEYFVTGEATAYEEDGEWGTDGEWSITASTTAPFTTRILVRRPEDPSRFNGAVVVEWLNVSSNVDVDVDFGYIAEEVLRGGYAWVGVSAQEIAVTSSGGSDFGESALGLKAWDPERYGDLEHPGDAYSYDIFSQVGAALRSPGDVDPLAGLEPEHLLADGESQSAFRMLTYVNAIHPVAQVYDGFLIHSRSGSGAPISDGANSEAPDAARIRTDLDAPVMQVQSETDLLGLGQPFTPARQPDTDLIRTWEIAGTAHADVHYLRSLYEQGTRQFEGFLDLPPVFEIANDGPQHFVMKAALRALHDWVTKGTPPPQAGPIEVADGAIVRDEHGNALGGVRTPPLDVPAATLTGEGAQLIGSTIPFDGPKLTAIYGSHTEYRAAYEVAADEAVAAGFVLAEDLEALLDDAAGPEAFAPA